jgi:hypothetical protein
MDALHKGQAKDIILCVLTCFKDKESKKRFLSYTAFKARKDSFLVPVLSSKDKARKESFLTRPMQEKIPFIFEK